ncbi:MAG: hypothetical protein LBF62_09240 [Tannerellaceae bacterium]|jgi:hypothetical protein|nr:hypothetical protein [Tannerellaceae bacterium]
MKTIKYISACLLLLMACLTACYEGIDPLTPVAPGADGAAPVIKINYPSEGTLIRVKEDVTSLSIELEVTDDIELQTVSVSLDGKEIAAFGSFKDYRRAVEAFTYSQLGNGVHTLTVAANDLSGKTSSASVRFEKVQPYKPVYGNEQFYMPFDGDFMEMVSIGYAAKTGNPGFADGGKKGKAFAGAPDSYLTFPAQDAEGGVNLLQPEFSALFWYKLNASPDRAGILVISPEDAANPEAMNNRLSGFRFFREGSATKQTFKLNAGNGEAESWFDGGDAASLYPANAGWVHIAFTISASSCVIYFNGEAVCRGDFSGIDWNDCSVLSVGSGAPRFTGWSHLSDQSLIDELRIFDKALAQQEILSIFNAEK